MNLYLDHLDEQARQRNQRRDDWARFWQKLLTGSGKEEDPLANLRGDELLQEFIAQCGSEEIGREACEQYLKEREAKSDGAN